MHGTKNITVILNVLSYPNNISSLFDLVFSVTLHLETSTGAGPSTLDDIMQGKIIVMQLGSKPTKNKTSKEVQLLMLVKHFIWTRVTRLSQLVIHAIAHTK